VGLKLNRKKLASVFYADNVNLLDAGTHKEQSSFISCQYGGFPGVNAVKTIHTFMSAERSAGKNHKIKTANKTFQNVAKLNTLE
jgi:hypothetical protein